MEVICYVHKETLVYYDLPCIQEIWVTVVCLSLKDFKSRNQEIQFCNIFLLEE